jgi:hypothetical protein
MSVNDQADGFFEDERDWGKCSHLECRPYDECLHALEPNENSGKGKPLNIPEKDVWQLTHGAMQFRLTKGFNMRLRSER